MGTTTTGARKRLMTPAQAADRHLLVDGSQVVSIGTLAQWRYVSRVQGAPVGPPYRKIGGNIYYEVEAYDKFMQGERS